MRALILILATSACSAPLRSTIELTRDELQARLEEKFPIEERVFVIKLVLENPAALLDETSDRIGVECDVAVRLGLIQYPGKLGVVGRLEYDRVESTVFLVDPEVITLRVPDLPEEHETRVREAVSRALRTRIARIPVHRFDGVDERALVQNVDVKNGRVFVEIGL